MMRRMRLILLCGALVAACSPVLADDFLGIYVGAGVGRSALVQDDYQIDSHATGWKLLAGWRPISFLGVEAEYADLGSKGTDSYGGTDHVIRHVETNAKATAVYAVGYLPVPLPWIDLYAKVGAAQVKANTTATYYPPSLLLPSTTDNDRTSVAWGAGLQFKWSRLAARVDYERFDGPQGDPSLLAAEFIFNF